MPQGVETGMIIVGNGRTHHPAQGAQGWGLAQGGEHRAEL